MLCERAFSLSVCTIRAKILWPISALIQANVNSNNKSGNIRSKKKGKAKSQETH